MLAASGLAAPRGLPANLTGISADSRTVRPGMLYAALPGARLDGRDFIADAVARGAVAVLAPSGTEWPPGVPPVPLILDEQPRRALARLAAQQAGRQPSPGDRGYGHQRQDQHRRVRPPDQAGERRAGGEPGDAGRDRTGSRQRSRPDDARPGGARGNIGRAGAARRAGGGDRGVIAWARSVPAGWRAIGGGRVQQSHPRPSRLSRHARSLPPCQAAVVSRLAAGRSARRRQHTARRGDDGGAAGHSGHRVAHDWRGWNPASAEAGDPTPRWAGAGDCGAAARSIYRCPGGSRRRTRCWRPVWRCSLAPATPSNSCRNCRACAGGWNSRPNSTVRRSMWITLIRRTRWSACCSRSGRTRRAGCTWCSAPAATGIAASGR